MEEVGVGESSFLVEAEAYVAAYLGKVVVVGMVVAVHQGTCAEEVGDAVVVAWMAGLPALADNRMDVVEEETGMEVARLG